MALDMGRNQQKNMDMDMKQQKDMAQDMGRKKEGGFKYSCMKIVTP